MVKQNPVITIGFKRTRYLSPPHFLMFVPFPWSIGDLHVFFLTNSYILEKIKTSKNQIVLLFCFENWNHFFYVLPFAVTRCITRFHSENVSVASSSVGIYLFKVSNRNTRTRCEIGSKLTIKTPERRQWRHSGVFIVNFEHISHLALVLLLLTLRR